MCISNLFPLSFLFSFSFFGTKPFCAPHQRNSFHVHLVSPFNKDKVLKIKKRVLNLSQTKKFKGRGGKMKGGLLPSRDPKAQAVVRDVLHKKPISVEGD